MVKKILLINGSPRKSGLTNNMIKIFEKKIEHLNNEEQSAHNSKVQTESLNLTDFSVQHCQACDQCLRKPHICPLSENDDMHSLEKKMKGAHAIIIGSPSYFSNVTGYVKDLIDRTRPMKMDKYQLKDKYFSPIVSSGLRAGGLNTVQNSLIQYALIQGMVVVGALGHPVLMANLPTESGQKFELTNFRKTNEISPVSQANIEALATRFWQLLQ